MKTSDFDKKFDGGDDLTGLLDLSKARRPGLNKSASMWIFRPGWCNPSIEKRIVWV